MIENRGEDESGGDSTAVPLDMTSDILDKIIEYLKYHFDDNESDEEQSNCVKRTDDLCEWDRKFIDVNRETLFGLILAANYLNIKGFQTL